MNNPLVSIITNTYNRADLIYRCIESIQKQTYQNYEHIIVDGNSTDNTEEVVKSYNDKHIKYIKLDKTGPQVQMRAGADVACGKYITFLDDDDEYLPEKLEKQVSFFEKKPQQVGLVYCWMSYFDFNNPNKVLSVHKTEIRGNAADISVSAPLVCGTPTLMVRREIFEAVGGCYDDSIGIIGADWELAARFCQICDVDYIPESLVKVYVNHGHARLSTNFYQDRAKKGIVFHHHFLNFFSENFKRHPEYAKLHYYSLACYYSDLKLRKEAWKYVVKYLSTKPEFGKALKLLVVYFFGH